MSHVWEGPPEPLSKDDLGVDWESDLEVHAWEWACSRCGGVAVRFAKHPPPPDLLLTGQLGSHLSCDEAIVDAVHAL